MKKNNVIMLALVIVAGSVVAVSAAKKTGGPKNNVTSNSQASSQDAAMVKARQEEAIKKGSGYITYADYAAKKDNYKNAQVVLYFHAPWCPTCQALDKDITDNVGNLPANTLIVKTDYDSSTELKQKYGVNYQHTLVQVDQDGNKIKKWSGSPELKDLIAEIQT